MVGTFFIVSDTTSAKIIKSRMEQVVINVMMFQNASNCNSDPVVRDGEGRDRRAVPGDDGGADGAAEAPDLGEQAAAGDGREGTGEAAAGEEEPERGLVTCTSRERGHTGGGRERSSVLFDLIYLILYRLSYLHFYDPHALNALGQGPGGIV